MLSAAICFAVLAFTGAQFPPLPSTCASTTCFVDSACREVRASPFSDLVQGQCLDPDNIPKTGNERSCRAGGQPLLVNIGNTFQEERCGLVGGTPTCPPGWTCVFGANETQAVCCQGNGGNVCNLPKIPGPCRGALPRFFFNKFTGTCDRFTFGGCQGNENNFETSENCTSTCATVICQLPKKVGPCEALIPRYFFNDDAGRCERFTFGGCQGNANNFETLEDCANVCAADMCQLPKKVGPCKARIPRYFFNDDTGRCESFNFGGCQGNANNFDTLEECTNVCDSPAKGGTCPPPPPNSVGICANLCTSNSSCPGNQLCCPNACGATVCQDPKPSPPPITCRNVRCPSGTECILRDVQCVRAPCPPKLPECVPIPPTGDICQLPRVVGPCRAAIRKYFFNKDTDRCESFSFGGCGGNENNFETLKECTDKCAKGGTCPPPPPNSVGICANLCTFNSSCPGSQLCCPNACGATVCQGPQPSPPPPSCRKVRCPSGTECVLKARDIQCVRAPCPTELPVCVPLALTADVCQLPKVVGPCKAAFRRYFFNKDTGRCESFIFGGCQGNENNFPTLEECTNRCAKGGTCPPPPPNSVGICASTCTSNSSCPGSQLCCPNACGATVCQDPQPSPPPPSCRTVKCSRGRRCVLQQVQCVTTPCFPQPVCVSIRPKAGSCPRSRFGEVCGARQRCSYDSECPGAEKCCRSFKCGRVCRKPRQPRNCREKKCKRGETCMMQNCRGRRCPVCVERDQCPSLPFYNSGCRFPSCAGNRICLPGKKCCVTRCGQRCLTPRDSD